ncbi:flavodoxin domain-containing protein [Pseudidiomarina donghaiensis]|uniref:Flavodoxin n=1 Tax=Pseudidiomarina donghaiensis TaxID=519452 RepID=A0A432XGL2_9GAMM|nr:flavodoxin domain-containing protein [Pseudidiomarina donghaiensis]RUO47894.1 flavodoxin [Pseudidiomarina donghaiensis]SFV22559.1 MioC protein [Pseudidiomarina donghaiensis]
MAAIDILVATTSGNTEYLADQLANQLQQAGHSTNMHYEPDYSNLIEALNPNSVWLCCVASHGAGDYADSMLDFAEELHQHKPSLTRLKYGVIAVGDSCYDTYCAAGRDCDAMLAILGAKRLITHLEIDMSQDDPDEKSSTWLETFIKSL